MRLCSGAASFSMLLEDCPERGIAICCGTLQVAGFPVSVDAIGIHIAAVPDDLLFESVRHFITDRHESMPELIRRDRADLVRFTILVPAVAKGLLTERLTLFVWKNPLANHSAVVQLFALCLDFLHRKSGPHNGTVCVFIFTVCNLSQIVNGLMNRQCRTVQVLPTQSQQLTRAQSFQHRKTISMNTPVCLPAAHRETASHPL